ncbi:MAG: HD domain-containing protein [Spirochaetales bacterium]|nr:HD domain-containing protein [Spirochaetales bacterium]
MENLFFDNPLSREMLLQRRSPRREDVRGAYFRDATAILHSFPFRRLKHKTQVFFAPENDHICTRIEHVLHVSTIATTICKALGLDSELAWAIGLGHDLGHTPFGHVGENIVEKLVPGKDGFAHEMYSLRVVDHLIGYGKGLNLTYAVRDGIVNHCGEKFEQLIEPAFHIRNLSTIKKRDQYPATWEGCVVRMSDKIAYLGRDLEDALQLKIITEKDVPPQLIKLLGRENGAIIDTLVSDIIQHSLRIGKIGFSDEIYQGIIDLKDFNYRMIYNNERLVNYHSYFERILTTLYTYLDGLFVKYGNDKKGYKSEQNILALRFYDYMEKMSRFYREVDGSFDLLVIDYLAGMTDDYAIKSVQELMVPRRFESQFHDLIFE